MVAGLCIRIANTGWRWKDGSVSKSPCGLLFQRTHVSFPTPCGALYQMTQAPCTMPSSTASNYFCGVYVFLCLCVHLCASICTSGSQKTLAVLLYHSLSYSIETESLTGPEGKFSQLLSCLLQFTDFLHDTGDLNSSHHACKASILLIDTFLTSFCHPPPMSLGSSIFCVARALQIPCSA